MHKVFKKVSSTLDHLNEQLSHIGEDVQSGLMSFDLPPASVALFARKAEEAQAWLEDLRRQLTGCSATRGREPPEWGALREDAMANMARLVKKKELSASAEFVKSIGWTKQSLSKAVQSNRVFFLELEGGRYFPAFFADPRYQRKQLETVSKLLGDLPGSSRLQFFMTPMLSLQDSTPLEALQRGIFEKVKVCAQRFAQPLSINLR